MADLYFYDGQWFSESEYHDYLEARYEKRLREDYYDDMPDPFEDR